MGGRRPCDPAYSGSVIGSAKKRFGFLPTDSVQGTLSQIIPVRSGQHTLRVGDALTLHALGVAWDEKQASVSELIPGTCPAIDFMPEMAHLGMAGRIDAIYCGDVMALNTHFGAIAR